MTSLLMQTLTNVWRIQEFVSTVAVRIFPDRLSAFALKDSPLRPSVRSESTWTSAVRRECAITASASTWMDHSNASAIPVTNCRQMAKLASVSFHRFISTNCGFVLDQSVSWFWTLRVLHRLMSFVSCFGISQLGCLHFCSCKSKR